MDDTKFIAAYGESRNGANQMYQHPLSRHFIYSDGVKECAEAGCYWLLDILATEGVKHMRAHPDEFMLIVKVGVRNESALINGELRDDDPNPWKKRINYTDMPEGLWIFYITWDGEHYTLILPSEY